MTELIFLYLLVFIYLSWKRLDWAIMIIIFALWSYLIRFTVVGVPITLLEAMILIVFVIWVIKYGKQVLQQAKTHLRERRSKQRYPFDWEIVLLLILSLVAVATAGWTDTAMGVWKAYFLEPILLFLVVFNVLGKDKLYDKIIYPLFASATILSLFAIYQKLTGSFVVPEFWTDTAQRATSIFTYPNALGLYLAPIIMILVGWLGYQLAQPKSGWKSLVRITGTTIVILLSIIAIICAQSDGALFAVMTALIIFGLLANRRVAKITFVITVIGVTLFLGHSAIRQTVVDKVTLFDLSGQIRQQQWKETWQMLSDGNWLLGSGLSNYQTIIEPYHQDGIFVKNHDPKWLDKVLFNEEYNKQAWQPVEIYLYPHNIFLNFWTELGLIGVLLFIWLMIKYLVMGLKNAFTFHNASKYLALGLTGAMITVIMHGLVDVPYFKNDLAVLFWLLFAVLGVIHTHNKRSLF